MRPLAGKGKDRTMQGTEITLAGSKRYTIVLDAAALFAYKEKAGKGIFQMESPPDFTEIVTLVWAMTRAHHPYLAFEKLKSEVQPSDYMMLVHAVEPYLKAEYFGMKLPGEGDAAQPHAGDAPPLAAS